MNVSKLTPLSRGLSWLFIVIIAAVLVGCGPQNQSGNSQSGNSQNPVQNESVAPVPAGQGGGGGGGGGGGSGGP